MKTSELTGAALDWAVAKCEKRQTTIKTSAGYRPWIKVAIYRYNPSTDWAQGGPIIERERINVDPSPDEEGWYSYYDNNGLWWYADSPLIAAMRCYVASKLGDEVEIPEELCAD